MTKLVLEVLIIAIVLSIVVLHVTMNLNIHTIVIVVPIRASLYFYTVRQEKENVYTVRCFESLQPVPHQLKSS